jgi:NADH-quinone oxidoreductase subunit G
MEGLNRQQPGALLPYVWAPGWNSNQSLHKFQSEVGGALSGGTAGVRLLGSPAASEVTAELATPPATAGTTEEQHANPGEWQLVARYRIFGSDELSALSPGIAELVDRGFLELRSADAESLGLAAGDGVQIGEALATLEVRINDEIAASCAGFSAGLPEALGLVPGARVALSKATDWRRAPQVIGSDGGARD